MKPKLPISPGPVAHSLSQIKNQESRIKNPPSSFVIRYSSFVAAILLATTCPARADLVANSPFIPEGWKPPSERVVEIPKIQAVPVNLELRGTDEWNGTKSFYLFDRVKNAGRWINLNDESADTPVLAFNQTSDTFSVDVRINGKVEKISLKKSDNKALEVKGLAEAPVPAAAQSVGGSSIPAGTPGQPPPPAPIRRRVILPGQPPEGQPAPAGVPQIDANNPNNAAILKMVEGANSQVAPAIPPPPQ